MDIWLLTADGSDQLKVLRCPEGSSWTQGMGHSSQLPAQAGSALRRQERKPIRLG